LLLLETSVLRLLVSTKLHEVFLLSYLSLLGLSCLMLRWRARSFSLVVRLHIELLKVIHSGRFLHGSRLGRSVTISTRVYHSLIILCSIDVIFFFVLYNHLREHSSEILALVSLLALSSLTLRFFFRLLSLVDLFLEVSCILFLEVVLVGVFFLESGKRSRGALSN